MNAKIEEYAKIEEEIAKKVAELNELKKKQNAIFGIEDGKPLNILKLAKLVEALKE